MTELGGGIPEIKRFEDDNATRQEFCLGQVEAADAELKLAEAALHAAIAEAQRQGVSWSKIGNKIGVTAQAAQQRHKRYNQRDLT